MTGGVRLYRVRWVPGSDNLLGRCYCGAERVLTDPTAVWDWLLAHPVGHDVAAGTSPDLHDGTHETDDAGPLPWMDRS